MRGARKKYLDQRCKAKARGIAFNLTFEQWLLWWGDDLRKRGVGSDELQMQRPMDRGGYELGNIRKGTPRENRKTSAAMTHKANSDSACRYVQDALDAAMFAPSSISDDPDTRRPEDRPIGEAHGQLGLAQNKLWR